MGLKENADKDIAQQDDDGSQFSSIEIWEKPIIINQDQN